MFATLTATNPIIDLYGEITWVYHLFQNSATRAYWHYLAPTLFGNWLVYIGYLALGGVYTFSEEDCVRFLQNFGFFEESVAVCPGTSVKTCGKMMKIIKKRTKRWRYTSLELFQETCRAQSTIKSTNCFYAFEDSTSRKKCNLKLCEIFLLVYFFLYSDDSIAQLMTKTGHASHNVCDWLNTCIEVCIKVVSKQPKMIGTKEQPVEIDESFFQGRKKYNQGRMRKLSWEGEKEEAQESWKYLLWTRQSGRPEGLWHIYVDYSMPILRRPQ